MNNKIIMLTILCSSWSIIHTMERPTKLHKPNHLGEELFEAIMNNNYYQVKFLIESGADIHYERYNETPLCNAASRNREPICKLLLAAGANVNHREGHNAPLSWAARNSHKSLTKIFIEAGAHINQGDYHGQTALHWAREPSICQQLIAAGANVNSKTKSGNTPLHYATIYGFLEKCDLLLKNGADIFHCDRYGDSSLRHAIQYQRHNSPFICDFLVEKMVNAITQDQKNAVYTFMNFLRRNFSRSAYNQFRDIFKGTLRDMIRQENKDRTRAEINRIEDRHEPLKKHLLETYCD